MLTKRGNVQDPAADVELITGEEEQDIDEEA